MLHSETLSEKKESMVVRRTNKRRWEGEGRKRKGNRKKQRGRKRKGGTKVMELEEDFTAYVLYPCSRIRTVILNLPDAATL